MQGLRLTDDEWSAWRRQMLNELQSLSLPEWPVYAPAGDAAVRHWEVRDGAVTSLDVIANWSDPSALVAVSCHAAGHPSTMRPSLGRRPPRFSMWQPFTPAPPSVRLHPEPTVDNVVLNIDGVDHAAQRRHRGAATTYQLAADGVEVQVIVMNDPDLVPPQLVQVDDLTLYVERGGAFWPADNPAR